MRNGLCEFTLFSLFSLFVCKYLSMYLLIILLFQNCIHAEFLSPNSNLKMTVERSKRRSFLSLIFTLIGSKIQFRKWDRSSSKKNATMRKKTVVVEGKDTICVLPAEYGKSLSDYLPSYLCECVFFFATAGKRKCRRKFYFTSYGPF